MPPKALVQGIQSYGTTWTGFSTWPPQDTQSATYFLSPGATLQNAAPAGGSASYVVAADGSSTGLTFATPAFATPTTVAGEVAVKLRVSFTATDGNVIVQLSDLSPNGTQKSIGINKYLKVSHRTSDSSPSPVVPGQVYDLALTIPSKYWTFGTGHKLVLTVTSSDPVVDNDAPAGTVSVNFGPGSSVQLLRR